MKKIIKKTLLLFVSTATLLLAFSLSAFAVCSNHFSAESIIPATLTEDGKITYKCESCGQVLNDRVIPKIETVKLKKTKITFDGTEKRPELIVLDREGNPIDENYYNFRWNYKRKIGTYTCSVEFFDYYNGEVTLSYKIVSPIKAPKLKETNATSKGAKIEWEKQKKATGYIVYRKSGDSSWKRIGTTKKTYYVDSTAVYNKTYKYTVKAYYKPEVGRKNIISGYDKKGLSVKMTHVVTPSAPTVSSKSLYASIKINAVKGATKYRIYKATSKDGEYKLIYTTKKGELSYTDKSAKINKTYYYKVRAYVGSKASSLSVADKVLIKLDTPKINKTVNVTSSTVTFKWRKVKGADYYRIYHREGVNSDWKRVKTVKAGDELTYKDKFPGNLNEFSVVAFKKLSSKTKVNSSRSEILYANPIVKPKITVEYPSATDSKIWLNINIGSRPDYYTVYCKEGENGSWKVAENAYENFTGGIYRQDVKLNIPYYFAVKSYYKSDDFTVYGQLSDVVYVMLRYNPEVEVILPKESAKSSTFPVTIKNNSANTLRLYSPVYLEHEDFTRNGEIAIFDPYYEQLNKNGYVDIPAHSSVTVKYLLDAFSDYNKQMHYNRKCSIIFKFRQNGVDYYSSYSNYYGKSFNLNKE